ncbi:LysR family transcriptional regulator [Sinomonas mesophila]|uniref:LysR family transcriptional regulator n=1 Tax=Sinomonas mesophila TaxID=1531955 RepID=UPI0009864C7A|nr:LysR family transcriptional regulator [Sinomonas mesophila]
MLEVRRLVLLRELGARGSIAAVSRSVGISSSAISQQLAKLEDEVGLRLLEQVGRHVHLTQAGRQLVRTADQVVAVLEDAEAELERRRSRVQGVVRLAAFSTFALRYLPDVVRRLAETHPDVVLEFDQLEPAAALDVVTGRRADIAVIDEYPHSPRRVDSEVRRFHLLRDGFTVFVPHEVGSIHELARLPWVFEPAESDAAHWARRLCREAGFEPIVRFESPDLRLHHGLAVAGVAAALLPDMLFGGSSVPLQEPTYRFDWPQSSVTELHRDVYAVIRPGAQNRPAVAAVLGHLQAPSAP